MRAVLARKWQFFELSFKTLCLMITLGLILFWSYKFILNEDLSIVAYKEYDDEKDGSPYLSQALCFRSPFLSSDKMQINKSQKLAYEKYLSGDASEDNTVLNYQDSALNLTDYIQNYYIRSRNGTRSYYEPNQYKFQSIKNSFNGFWLGNLFRCFNIVMPDHGVAEISILVNNSIFNEGIRPMVWDFFVMFHYPNQILRPSLFENHYWPTPRAVNDSTYEMLFYVENVEIFKRRKDCNPKYLNYDDQIMEYFVKKIGCSPPYYETKLDVPTCTTLEDLKKFSTNVYLGMHHGFDPPCKSLEFMTFKYSEIDFKGTTFDIGGNFAVSFVVSNLIHKVNVSLVYINESFNLTL